jgi:hypothetical protein
MFNHAYLWDERTGAACGRGMPKDRVERGPNGGDVCRRIDGSDGKEDEIMKCCMDTAGSGYLIPYLDDCHQDANYCIRRAGLINPGVPGGRIGKPCSSCGSSFEFDGIRDGKLEFRFEL